MVYFRLITSCTKIKKLNESKIAGQRVSDSMGLIIDKIKARKDLSVIEERELINQTKLVKGK